VTVGLSVVDQDSENQWVGSVTIGSGQAQSSALCCAASVYEGAVIVDVVGINIETPNPPTFGGQDYVYSNFQIQNTCS
jgi:hypothetical protein